MSVRHDVADLLDLYYAQDGHEPDWAAVETRIMRTRNPYAVLSETLKCLWAVNESDDVAAQKTLLWVLTT